MTVAAPTTPAVDRYATAAAAWTQLEAALLECDGELALIPQLRSRVEPLALSAFCAIGGLARWHQLNEAQLDELRLAFLEEYSTLARVSPAPAREVDKPAPPAAVLRDVPPERAAFARDSMARLLGERD